MVDRRAVTAGLIGFGALPVRGLATQRAAKGVVEGQPTWSESAMVLYFDAEARNGLSLRISRYPERGETVWLHLLADGVLYTFTDSQIPCSADKITAELPSAIYPSPGLEASISRLGTSAELKAMSFSAELRAHKGTSGRRWPRRRARQRRRRLPSRSVAGPARPRAASNTPAAWRRRFGPPARRSASAASARPMSRPRPRPVSPPPSPTPAVERRLGDDRAVESRARLWRP